MIKKIVSPKYLLIFVFAFIFFISGSDNSQVSQAQSGDLMGLSGFAWSENFGWISFNSSDCAKSDFRYCQNIISPFNAMPYSCTTEECALNGGKCIDWCYKCNDAGVDYICDNTSGPPLCPIINPTGFDCTSTPWKVQIDTANGDLYGYAWSPYLDYISFERGTAGDPPAPPYASGPGPIARYGLSGNPYGIPEKFLDGWARILLLTDAGGNQNGWIRLSGTAEDSTDYGAYVAEDGQLEGYAWNGNSTASSGVGWIKFNSRTAPASAQQYNVWAPIPTKPIASGVLPVPPDNCSTLEVSWQDSANENGYWLYASTSPTFFASDDSRYAVPINQDITHAVVNTVPPVNASLQPGDRYYFIVGAYNIFGTSYSDIFSGQTYPICRSLFEIDLKGECPGIVHLFWDEPAHAASCVIDDYSVRRCHCTGGCANCDDGANYAVAFSTGGAFTDYDDMNFDDDDGDLTNDTYDKYRYQIKASCASGEEGEWSEPSDIVIPCPSIPTWQEKKPN